MPISAYSEEQIAAHLALLEPSMVFILDKLKITRLMQAHLAANGLVSLSRFSILGDDVTEVKKVLKKDTHACTKLLREAAKKCATETKTGFTFEARLALRSMAILFTIK